MAYQSGQRFRRNAVPADIVSPPIPISLPRGRMDVQLRLTAYANGSRALELKDPDGQAIYAPTLPCCPTTMASMLRPEDADAMVVAIRPSALRNGIAHALMEAGLLIDLDIEMPVDRHWVRLMRLDMARVQPDVSEQPPEPEPIPLSLPALPVPANWQPTALRIQQAMRRHGKAISLEDAMLAWALHSRAIQRMPAPLPPTAEEIHDRLLPFFHESTQKSGQNRSN